MELEDQIRGAVLDLTQHKLYEQRDTALQVATEIARVVAMDQLFRAEITYESHGELYIRPAYVIGCGPHSQRKEDMLFYLSMLGENPSERQVYQLALATITRFTPLFTLD